MRNQLDSYLARLPRSGWLLGIGDQFVVSGGSFVFGMIVARTSSPAEFGIFALGMTIVYVLVDVHLGLISTPLAIRVHRYKGASRDGYVGSTIVHQIILSVLLAVGLGAGWFAYANTDGGELAISPVIAAISSTIALTLLREYLRRYLFIKNWVAGVFAFDAAITSAQVTVLVGIAALGAATAPIAHAVMGAVCGGFAIPLLLRLRTEFRISRRRVWRDLKANFQLGGWIATNNVLWSLGIYAYPWLLATMHGAKAAGLWAACTAIIGIVNLALVGILNVLTPRIATANATGGLTELRQYVFLSSVKYVGFALAVVSVPIMAGELLVTLVYGSQFQGTSGVIAVLGVNTVFMAASGCIGRGLMVAGRANWDFAVNVAALVMVFTLGWWSTATYGPFGAAVGLTVANALGAVIRVIAFDIMSRPAETKK